MTVVTRCNKCGAEVEEFASDCNFLSVSFFRHGYKEVNNHYCPSCAYDLMDSLGVNMQTWDEYDKARECNCRVCKEAL